ncbi:methyl-accepting chemotaxis protein [Agaribacter marinus]|uniref:Methyl-accepting chemotaxis protein n=1 Tax=Agaribacter marinus TaxID=1431249 RepID=A0AA37WMD9_9ALTE|nr:methyl-accepting chemotaxis protein [Agaribacter marinus]GLR72725.1 methyl-accepting chemotaxis protein [Agaribacter marinus]
MFSKLNLSTQISISIASIMCLMLVVAGISYLGLDRGHVNFVKYRSLARDTNLAGRLQANLLMVRLNAIKYIQNDSPLHLEHYQTRFDNLKELFQEANKQITDPIRAKDIASSMQGIEKYEKGFDEVVSLIEQRHSTVNDELNPSGLAMRQRMTQIIEMLKSTNRTDALYSASKAQEALLLGRLYVIKFLVTNSDDDYQRAKKELEIEIADDLLSLEEFLNTEQSSNLFKQFKQQYSTYIQALNSVYSTINKRNNIIKNVLDTNGANIATLLENTKLSVKREQDDLGPKAEKSSQDSVDWLKMAVAFCVLLGVAAVYSLPKTIRRPIGGESYEIANVVKGIAKGDLTANFKHAESATGIYKYVIEMTQSLRRLIGGVVETSSRLTENAHHSAEVAKLTNQAIDEQRKCTGLVVIAVNDMSQSINEVVNMSNESARAASEAQNQVLQGKTTVDSTLASIESLAKRVSNSVDVIKSLEKNSQEIGSVVEVIKNISEQTNLLALNAAIEAARAGDQGRGFAVVADEVRGLAQRTQESTNEINEMISALQSGTKQAVLVMEESGSEAEETVSKSVATGEVLDSILAVINDINATNGQVANAVQQQASATKAINQNVAVIEESSEKAGSEATKSAEASDKLLELVDELCRLISGFKTK